VLIQLWLYCFTDCDNNNDNDDEVDNDNHEGDQDDVAPLVKCVSGMPCPCHCCANRP